MESRESTLGHPVADHHLVESIGVRIMNVVVDTRGVSETSRLPEFTSVVTGMISVK